VYCAAGTSSIVPTVPPGSHTRPEAMARWNASRAA
jgi:hypothetical protein